MKSAWLTLVVCLCVAAYGLGLVLQAIQVKHFNAQTGLAILRTSRDSVKVVQAAVAMITEFRKVKVAVDTLHTSATIQHCQKAAIKLHRRELRALQAMQQADAAVIPTQASVSTSRKKRKRGKEEADEDEDGEDPGAQDADGDEPMN